MIHVYGTDDPETIARAFREGITFVIFSAPWCGSCRAIRRTVKEFDALGKFAFVEVNVDEHKEFAAGYNVRGIPVVLFLKDGKVLDRIAGSLDYEEFRAWILRQDGGKDLL